MYRLLEIGSKGKILTHETVRRIAVGGCHRGPSMVHQITYVDFQRGLENIQNCVSPIQCVSARSDKHFQHFFHAGQGLDRRGGQLRLIGSFGCNMGNIASSLEKLASGQVHPVIDLEIPMEDIEKGLERLENRQVFGKIIVTL